MRPKTVPRTTLWSAARAAPHTQRQRPRPQYRPFLSSVVLVVVAAAGIAWGIWSVLGGSRAVAYAWAVALLVLGAVGIVDEGGVRSNPQSSPRIRCSTPTRGAGNAGGGLPKDAHLLRLICPCTETGALNLEVSASLSRRNPRNVRLAYTSESLLGLWGDRLAVTSVNGEDARSSQPIGFKRGRRPLLIRAASGDLLLMLRVTDYRNPPSPSESDEVGSETPNKLRLKLSESY